MANEEFSPAELEKLRKVFQDAALSDFPNPDRIGCPSDKSVLKAMAAKTLPPTDPAWRHAARCSPCFREIKQFEAGLKRSRLGKVAAVAAIVFIVVGLLVFRDRLLPHPPDTLQTATLDLRPFSVSRGEPDASTGTANALTLRRGHLTLSVLLPLGSEPGHYEFKILNDSLQQVAAGDGEARLQNPDMVLTAPLDTSTLAPGRFTLWLRQRGYDWRSYRVLIR